MEKSKLSRQAKAERIQHHQISFTTNAKRTSPGRKPKRRKRLRESKAKTIKKRVIESYILIITLNVNGLNAPTKRQTGWVNENVSIYAFPLTTSFSLTPPPQIVLNILY